MVEDVKKIIVTREGVCAFLSTAFREDMDDKFFESLAAIWPTISFLAFCQEETN